MLTGDGRGTAEAIARRIGGIDEVHADLRPEDKARIVGELKAKGARVAMAGDGINDAPALAAADVGIAMGTGTDVAIESAGLTLIGGDLAAMVRARRLARATMANIRQNLFLLVRVQRRGRADRGGGALSGRGHIDVADVRGRGDGAVELHGGAQRAPAGCGEALSNRQPGKLPADQNFNRTSSPTLSRLESLPASCS